MNLVSKSVIDRINKRIDNIAESKSMTRKEFDAFCEAERDRSEISDDEVKLIFAYQHNQAIKRLENEGQHNIAESIKHNNWWIKTWRNDFYKAEKSIKHLTEVCSYWENNYNRKYCFEYLLNVDEVIYQLALDDFKVKGKARFKRKD